MYQAKYIYEIPYLTRKNLCRLLDLNEDWKELAARMEYPTFDIIEIENEYRRRGGSPSDSLLSRWSQHNHSILELFVLLSQMNHNPAMNCIKDLVDPKYRALIDMQIVSTGSSRDTSDTSSSNIHSCEENVDTNSSAHGVQKDYNPSSKKILNGPPYVDTFNGQVSSSKTTNDPVAESAQGVLRISYSELSIATQNWDSNLILGKGGFGDVFTGVWKNTQVAIKRLKGTNNGSGVTDELLRELRYLNACRHDNVLPLYGYSTDGIESCLVYQLMVGGSLEERLKCKNNYSPLSWKQRLAIAQGISKGLQFLHTVSKTPLIHGDIKSANILLDSCDAPRIGDFGLARKGPDSEDLTHLKVSRIHGTRPYLPEEFLRGGKLSVKVDVYSFGVVIFEIITGAPAYCGKRKYPFLKDHIVEQDKEGNLRIDELEDHRLIRIGESNLELCKDLLKVGLKCVEYRPSDRPNMVQVWELLSVITEE